MRIRLRAPDVAGERRLRGLVLLWLLCTVALIASGCTPSHTGESFLVYLPRTEGVRIVPNLGAQPPIVDVYSDTGIGGASFWLVGGGTPAPFTVRLHLRGLEGLTLGYDERVVQASLGSHGDHNLTESLDRRGDDVAPHLSPSDADWVRITPAYGEQADAFAAQPVYFDIELPAALLAGGHRTLSLDWVDFYR